VSSKAAVGAAHYREHRLLAVLERRVRGVLWRVVAGRPKFLAQEAERLILVRGRCQAGPAPVAQGELHKPAPVAQGGPHKPVPVARRDLHKPAPDGQAN